MPTELQNHKLDKAYRHLDVDGNGYVEREDLLALATRLMSEFGEPPNSAKGAAVLDTFDGFWQALITATDQDGDGRIDPAEWRAGMTGAFITADGGFDAALRPTISAVLQMADLDGDGVLGPEEFARMQRAFGTPAPEAEVGFAKLDSNNDGTLSLDELATGARDFYVGADEDAPGNWFFGKL